MLKPDLLDSIKKLVVDPEASGKRVKKAAIARQLRINRTTLYEGLRIISDGM